MDLVLVIIGISILIHTFGHLSLVIAFEADKENECTSLDGL